MRATIQNSCFTLVFMLLMGCSGGSGNEEASSDLVYARSELSELMLEMQAEAELMKQQLENGEALSFEVDYQAILTAQDSDSARGRSTNYQTFAHMYLQQMDTLQSSDVLMLSENFEKMLVTCEACHKAMCPGPLRRIEKLHLSSAVVY